MIVVSDTSAVTTLYQIGELDLLRLVYGGIVIPPAVALELDEVDNQWSRIEGLDWITVQEPINAELVKSLEQSLDFGESQAIALAVELAAEYIIIDERLGRSVASTYGVPVVGLVGVLIAAKDRGHIEKVKPIIEKAVINGFHLDGNFVLRTLKKLGEL